MGLILRTLIAIPLAMGLVLIGAALWQVNEGVYEMSQEPGMDGAEEAFGTEKEEAITSDIMFFGTVVLVALILVLFAWWIVGDLTSDVRQRETFR